MSARISRQNQVRIGCIVLILMAVGYGLSRFKTKLHEASVDAGVRNQLRNLHALARDYAQAHGHPATVQVSQLSPTDLDNAGIRPPLNGVFPTSIAPGQPLTVTGVDGRRTVVFDPRK